MRTLSHSTEEEIAARYETARDIYADYGVDTELAIEHALRIPISMHCWQGDDVAGLEVRDPAASGGGILATGGHPGRARTGDELREDYDEVLDLVPGEIRLNLHAMYAETGGQKVDRDALTPEHFARWMDWGAERGVDLDFNPTYFAHPRADDGFTLSHADEGVRSFWIAHGRACRRIAEAMARKQGSPCVLNHWIPDGAKDSPADRWSPRARLVEALDAVLDEAAGVDRSLCLDAVEGKLFGLGSEDYVVGSHEFYSHYALTRRILLCLDMGHFHPTESVADKLSALLPFHPELLLHTSRPIRWDSDHVVIFNDDLRTVFLEAARGGALDRIRVALDFFDASIHRVSAYVIGIRATRLALLHALLDPSDALRELEAAGRGAEKLAWMEQTRLLPLGAVWDMACLRDSVPPGLAWLPAAAAHEARVVERRRNG